MSRKLIAAMQVSLDGFVQGSDQAGEPWVESWVEALALIPDVDAFVQGAGMYPAYGEYWEAIHKKPREPVPFEQRLPDAREIAWAERASKTPHYIVSKTLTAVSWPPTARIVPDLAAIRALKAEPGRNVYVVGGPTLVSSLLNEGLLDELRLIVHPLLLGGGMPLFGKVAGRRALQFVKAEPADKGKIVLYYRT